MNWTLIKITHHEALASVARHPNAYVFTRTSYMLAPSSWREMDHGELTARLERVLLAGYAKRNHTLIGTDDPTPMELLSWELECVADSELPTRPWTSAFHAFRISEDGREWHIVHHTDVNDLFDKHLL